MKILRKFYFAGLTFIAGHQLLQAQLYVPPAFDMSGGASYILNSYSQSSSTYPPNMAIRFCGLCNNQGNFTDELMGEADHAPSGGAGKWRGENDNGVSVRGGTDKTRGSFVLRLNTTSRILINVQWKVRDIVIGSNHNFIELQWRVGAAGTWANVDNDLYRQGTTTSGTAYNVLLPSGASNQSDLRLRWIYYESGGSGARDRLSIDDINVSSDVLLPLSVMNFLIQKIPSGAEISWETNTHEGWDHYVIEHSTDSRSFEQLGIVYPSNSTSYRFNHVPTVSGMHFYRIKQVDMDGTIYYSSLQSLTFGKASDMTITFYPNIVIDRITVLGEFVERMHIIGSSGQKILTTTVKAGQSVDLTGLRPGIYYIAFDTGSKLQSALPLIKA